MELVTGPERTIDGIAWAGRVVLGHPKTREEMRAGLAMYFRTLADPILMMIAGIGAATFLYPPLAIALKWVVLPIGGLAEAVLMLWLIFKGVAAVGYVADRNLVGFGKIAEAMDALAHRLILQENLAHRICGSVMEALAPLGAGVVMAAEHGCMQVRGPKRPQSRVTVEAWAGAFERDAELRASLARRAEG